MALTRFQRHLHVLSAARSVHRRLGKRRAVEQYEAALSEELRTRGIGIRANKQTQILFGGTSTAVYLADIILDGDVLIEIKRAERLSENEKKRFGHFVEQIQCQRGYLLNFAADDLEVAMFPAE